MRSVKQAVWSVFFYSRYDVAYYLYAVAPAIDVKLAIKQGLRS